MSLSVHQVTKTAKLYHLLYASSILQTSGSGILGLTDVVLDDQCYLYGKLPATAGLEDKPAIGFIAHMDTVSDYCDHDIKPIVTENYDGGELKLGTSDTVLSPKNFPHLESLKGRTLITSDGTTVLGADDKAGIAEILTMIQRYRKKRFLTDLCALHLHRMKRSVPVLLTST